jgi:hypothetical protein
MAAQLGNDAADGGDERRARPDDIDKLAGPLDPRQGRGALPDGHLTRLALHRPDDLGVPIPRRTPNSGFSSLMTVSESRPQPQSRISPQVSGIVVQGLLHQPLPYGLDSDHRGAGVRVTNTVHAPMMQALALIKRY